jgi:hypothetical protein
MRDFPEYSRFSTRRSGTPMLKMSKHHSESLCAPAVVIRTSDRIRECARNRNPISGKAKHLMMFGNAAPLGLALLGLILGIRHATDADHVIAVTAILTRERRLRTRPRSASYGASGIRSPFCWSAPQSSSSR